MGIFFRKKAGASGAVSVNLHIALEHAGTPLYEMLTVEYSKEISIGRAADCTWSLNGVDSSVSSSHALISRRKNHFYLTDLGSRNGIYYLNKRIKERKLAPGDRIVLGDCVILVESVAEQNKKYSRFHRLCYLNDKGRQQIFEISKPQTVLGSAPDCDLIFQDQLISSRHAELLLKSDGSCWFRDLGSRNGSGVNGTELPPDTERLLQDNDVINLAHLDIRFWDAASEHHESRIRTAVAAVVITVAIVLIGYIAYGKMTPNAERLIDIAVQAMQTGNLAAAEDILTNSVPHAEGAAESDVQYRRVVLLRTIALWRNTINTWLAVQRELNAKNCLRAAQQLGTICGDDQNAWTWQNGGKEKEKALALKKILDSCSAASSGLADEVCPIERLEQIRRDLNIAITTGSKFKEAYFQQALIYARPFVQQLDKTLKDNQELRKALELLNRRPVDYAAVVANLSQIAKESRGPVQARAGRILPAVMTLQRETERMHFMIEKVSALDFRTVQEFKLNLPDAIDYSAEKNIGSLKNQLIDTVSLFKDTALQLSLIYEALVKRGVVPGKAAPVVPDFFNRAVMDKVYRADSLELPYPKRPPREIPAGEYDRMLGIEIFYDYVANVHAGSLTLNMDDFPVKPQIYQLKQLLVEIEKFINYADKDGNDWFAHGAFAGYLARCREILQQRDRIIAAQLARPDQLGTRGHLISRGIAAYLSPEGRSKAALELELAESFSALKRKLRVLNTKFNRSMPEEQLQIRRQIIESGLPGDPVLKIMWQQRPASGWEK